MYIIHGESMLLSVTMKSFGFTSFDSDSDSESICEKMTVGKTLSDVLVTAHEDRRLTCGLYESGLLLETDPDAVMLCVLPSNKSGDMTLDIHYTLIEAFCTENDIPLLKVDSAEKLSELLGAGMTTEKPEPSERLIGDVNDNDLYSESWPGSSTDYNCVLVLYPSDKCSEPEADLLEYHKQTCIMYPQPIIDLDV